MSELQRLLLSEQLKPGETMRSRRMSLLEHYYSNSQYHGLPRAWDEVLDSQQQPISFRSRRPSTVIPLPSLIVDTFTRALWATGRRPLPVIKGADQNQNQALSEIIAEAKLYRTMREATRRALTVGSGCVVWRMNEGRFCTDAWDAKHCTPTFEAGDFPCLERLEYKYLYVTEEGGRTVTKWHREIIDEQRWTVYQDVEVTADRDPKWREDTAATVDHNLGFVPAVWFTVGERCGYDGTGIYASQLGLFDDLNYTASQAGRALYQNLDPQLTISGITDADVDGLRKGGNVWAVPPGSEAKILESDGAFMSAAEKRLDYLRKQILDACAVTIHDAEKVKGAQSGTAIELLSAPMMARVSDLREDVGDCALVPLLEQILSAAMPGKSPQVLLHWGALSPTTTDDAKAAVEAATAAVESGILSKQAAARYTAPYLGVIDSDHDQSLVEGLTDALALNEASIPSPTFHRIRKTSLAKKHLAGLASSEELHAIEAEIAQNTAHDDLDEETPEVEGEVANSAESTENLPNL